jgi:hypothetical protein
MSLENSYSELVSMSHIKDKLFRNDNFKTAYLKCYGCANEEFSRFKVFAFPDNYETLDFLFEEERIKKEEKEISKIMIEQVEEEQKIQPIKREDYNFFAANREKNKILILFFERLICV